MTILPQLTDRGRNEGERGRETEEIKAKEVSRSGRMKEERGKGVKDRENEMMERHTKREEQGMGDREGYMRE